MALTFVPGCAARSGPLPRAANAACTVANLDQMGTSSIPIGVAGRDSMTAVASALAAAALRADPDARAFAYTVRFEHPYTPRAVNPPDFEMTGLFERACDMNNSLALGWGYAGSEADRANAAVVPLDPPPDCPAGRRTARPALYAAPVAETAIDHQPIHGWEADFPQIAEALGKNRASFANGVETIEVATVRRLKIDDARPTGCVRTIHIHSGHRQIDGNQDSRTVMELIEAGRPAERASLAGYCTAGHYLILDAATAAVLERGRYQRCEYFAADQI